MKIMQRFLMLTLALFIATVGQPVYAQDSAKININGQELTLDQVPVVVNGRTMVPVQEISEAFGLYVSWAEKLNAACIHKNNGEQIIITINKTIAVDAGRDVKLDVPAQIINGRTMVPLRFIGEALGATVNWDANTSTVTINTSGSISVTTSTNLNQQISNNETAINEAQLEYDLAEKEYNDLKSVYPAYWITGEIVTNEGNSIIVNGSAIGNGPGLTEGYIKIINPSKSGVVLYLYTGAHYFIQKEADEVYETVTVFGNAPEELQAAEDKCDAAKAELNSLNGIKQNLQETSAGIIEIKYSNSDYYKGTVNSSRQPNGNGRYVWANGYEYDGDWVNGMKNGKGIYKYSNGDYYEGNFTDNLYSGTGTLKTIYHQKTTSLGILIPEFFENEYTGEFKAGKYNGMGTLDHHTDILKYFKGEDASFSYEGEFKDGQFHGKGTLYDKDDNVVFNGMFENGSPVKGTEEEHAG